MEISFFLNVDIFHGSNSPRLVIFCDFWLNADSDEDAKEVVFTMHFAPQLEIETVEH